MPTTKDIMWTILNAVKQLPGSSISHAVKTNKFEVALWLVKQKAMGQLGEPVVAVVDIDPALPVCPKCVSNIHPPQYRGYSQCIVPTKICNAF